MGKLNVELGLNAYEEEAHAPTHPSHAAKPINGEPCAQVLRIIPLDKHPGIIERSRQIQKYEEERFRVNRANGNILTPSMEDLLSIIRRAAKNALLHKKERKTRRQEKGKNRRKERLLTKP